MRVLGNFTKSSHLKKTIDIDCTMHTNIINILEPYTESHGIFGRSDENIGYSGVSGAVFTDVENITTLDLHFASSDNWTTLSDWDESTTETYGLTFTGFTKSEFMGNPLSNGKAEKSEADRIPDIS